MTPTPSSLGFAMPAEWERHEATWLGWPHQRTDWPGRMGPVQRACTEIVRALCAGEAVRILVNDAAHERRARRYLERAGVATRRVEFLRFPTNRGWMRDTGPLFVRRRGRKGREVAVVDFHFNAWAKYRNWRKDRKVAGRAARRLGCRCFNARRGGRDFLLEGGSVDVNGRGTVLTTEECLLDQATQVRNPGMGREEVVAALGEHLGVRNVIWLGRGIAGDDTHGHVDDVCRFVGPKTLVLVREKNRRDANYRPLAENRERLQGARLEDGSRPEIAYLPMPAPRFHDGDRLPASYANFYIANAAVLVPTFDDPNDRVALGLLGELFRGRPVVGIDAADLVVGRGTLHCLTQQQP